jgi:hypothetical protein
MKNSEENSIPDVCASSPYTQHFLESIHDKVLSLFIIINSFIIYLLFLFIYLLYDQKWGQMGIVIHAATIFTRTPVTFIIFMVHIITNMNS